MLSHEGREYDVKAVIGAANGYQLPDKGPLKNSEFRSSDEGRNRHSGGLGFKFPLADWCSQA